MFHRRQLLSSFRHRPLHQPFAIASMLAARLSRQAFPRLRSLNSITFRSTALPLLLPPLLAVTKETMAAIFNPPEDVTTPAWRRKDANSGI